MGERNSLLLSGALAGATARELADRYGLKITTVQGALRNAGVCKSRQHAREKHYRDMLQAGMTQKQIAKQEGITNQAVSIFLRKMAKTTRREKSDV